MWIIITRFFGFNGKKVSRLAEYATDFAAESLGKTIWSMSCNDVVI
jgi:hypothetical protein